MFFSCAAGYPFARALSRGLPHRGFSVNFTCMSKLFTILKHVYRLLPPPLRKTGPLHSFAFRIMERVGDRNDIYSPKYYQTLVEPYARRSVPQMARSLVETFSPASVIDVGCGSGALLVGLRKLGVRRLLGLDSSEAGLDIARARGLDIRNFDIASDRWSGGERFDIAVSMETAEHLPKNSADRYVELLCSLAPVVIFTAAHPGQGGIGHLNEQPPEYWTERFKANGFQHAEKTVADWQSAWTAAGVANFYTRNLMVFQQS
ncbi:MAG: class I SAM-dependent methyltransferase [Kiritimatiellaceae bacterium]|nr:class I SAM-dependent methyltransferase [Kiritimatiellaceae bacterium]